MQVAELELYDILKSKLGEKEARTLVEYIEARVEGKFAEKKDFLAAKDDVSSLRNELKDDISSLRVEIEQLRAEVKVEIAQVRTEIQHSRADIIKWMFIFWIGQVATLIAILQIFFRN